MCTFKLISSLLSLQPEELPSRACLLAINSQFLSCNVLISPYYLKNSFAEYRIFELTVLSFSTFSTSSHWLLASLISEESAVNIIENPLYVMSHFFSATFQVLSLYLSFKDLIMIYLHVDFFEFILLGVH